MLLADQTAAVFEAAEALARLRGGKHVNAALLAHVDDRPVLQHLHRLADGLRRDVILARQLRSAGKLLPFLQFSVCDALRDGPGNPHILRKCVVFHRKSLLFPSFLSYYIN